MKPFSLLILWTLSFILYPVKSSAQPSADTFEEKPSWEEHFNGKGYPSESNWTVSETYTKQHLAHYVKNPHNVYVKRGKLHLVLRKDSTDTNSYTSGRIISKRTFSCGKLEFRAKCPTTEGVWDVIWLKPVKGKNVNGEIDLMEYIGCWKGQKYQVNFHLWGNFAGKAQNHIQKPRYAHIDISQFHVYTLEWYKERMIAKVDGNVVYDLKKGDLEEWPFDMPYQLIIALGYGPNWGGCGLDDNSLPQKLQVDWIRYYELKD